MKYKFETINYKVQEKKQFELHLNEMSEKGWNLSWFNEYVICYVKCNERKYYYIDFNPNVKMNAHRYIDDNQQKQIDLYEDMGYEFVSSYKFFMVFSATLQLSPLHTDMEVENVVFEKAKNSFLLLHVILPALINAFIFLIFLSNQSMLLFILSNTMMTLFLLLNILISLIIIFYSGYIGKHSQKKTTKQIKNRTFAILFVYTILFICILICIYGMSLNLEVVIKFTMLLNIMMINRAIFIKLLSSKDNRKILVIFIVILDIIIFLIYFQISKIDYKQSNEIEKTDIMLSEEIIGNYEKVSYYLNEESLFIKRLECDFTYQDENQYFDYVYYQDKTNILGFMILNELQKYRTKGFSYSIGEVDVYCEDESLDMYGDEEELEWASFIILRKNNEYVSILSSEKLNEDKIQTIIEELHWSR